MIKNRIIFILGTVRSGTTMLNLFIGNKEQDAMILGEVANLFNPRLNEHFEKIDELKGKSEIWRNIIADGPKKLYPNLQKYFPSVRLFIDSSKDPFWVSQQISYNESHFHIKSILIFKSFQLFNQSFNKRGLSFVAACKVYRNLHKRIFTKINNVFIISYKEFIGSAQMKEKLCDCMEIKYSPAKLSIDLREIEFNFFGSPSFKTDNPVITIRDITEGKFDKATEGIEKTPLEINQIVSYLNLKSGYFSNFKDAPRHLRYSFLYIHLLQFREYLRNKRIY